MGVRIFCDQCGNTIHQHNKFKFGPTPSYDEDEEEAPRSKRRGPAPITPEVIDLCDHCAPTWMTRVKSLTKKSDV
jgi:hypothetical protein